MPTIAPISLERHKSKRWKKLSSYAFAASEAIIPLVVGELVRVTPVMPIAFSLQGEEFVPVAVLGLMPNQNLFVMPDGKWNGPYVPAAFRSYPFAFLTAEDGKPVLCIDEDSGALTEGPEGSAFFGEDAKPTQPLADVVEFLRHVHEARLATQRMCRVLKIHGLIQPWPINLQLPTGEQRLDGLYRIDESALNALTPDAFLEVRASGSLLMIYCQLLSMQHMSLLGQLAGARAEAATRRLPVNQAGELDLEFLNDGPSLDFSRFK